MQWMVDVNSKYGRRRWPCAYLYFEVFVLQHFVDLKYTISYICD